MSTASIASELLTTDEHHAVQFYEDDAFLAARVAEYLNNGLRVGEPCVVIATAPHRRAFEARLRLLGVDVDAAFRDGHLRMLDAEETLDRLRADGAVESSKFLDIVGRVVREMRAAHGERCVRAYGEMVDVLWQRGDREAAIALEEMWNQLGARERIKLLCAYAMSGFPTASDGFARVCAVHTHHALHESAPRTQELEAEISRRREVERNLRAREQELLDFVETAMEGVHFVAQDGTILYANRAELEMLGYTRDEYIGRNIADVHVDQEVLADMLAKLVANEPFANREARLRCKDGSQRHVLVSSTALFRNGKFVHTRCFTRDVTNQKRANDALQLLAHASKVLATSRDYETALDEVVRAATRAFADGAIVRLLDDAGETRRRFVSGAEPPHASVLRVPLTAASKTVGELALSWSERSPAAGDRRVADDLARRIGAAIENAMHCEAIEAANRGKDEFLAVVSHELRTPLNAILGWSRMLHDARMPPEARARALDTIERNARAQNQLIEDLLDVSRIVSGKLSIDVEPVDLRVVVERAVEAVTPAATAKGIDVRVAIDAALAPLNADPHRLQQCIANLLNNAVKFSANGTAIDVTVSTNATGARIEVRDHGQGIAADLLPHVFERFRQGDSRASRTAGGLGLGLAIVKNLVELHGGRVTAESDGPGRGSTFTIHLDAAARDRPSAVKPIATRAAPLAKLDGLRVLVVDDEPDARHLVSAVLAPCGVVVSVASSAREAHAALERERFDAIVSDIGMPGEDGYAMIAAIRARATGGAIPVVALTAFARAEERTKILEAGFDKHLSKPVDPDELVAVVSAVIGAKSVLPV